LFEDEDHIIIKKGINNEKISIGHNAYYKKDTANDIPDLPNLYQYV